MDAVPKNVAAAIKAGKVDLNDPANTLLLLKANAVVGVTGFFGRDGKTLTSVGIQCALCHSTVDDAFMPGIGRRLDGWPNRDLNVGAIAASAADLSAFVKLLEVDEASVRKVLLGWGPGKFDAQLNLDGKGFRPDGKTAATLIPPAFGLAGVNNHTWTGGWGTVSYWNAYVGNLEMHGRGNFYDPRLDDAAKYPVAARTRQGHTQTPARDDRITAKLPALHFYQLSLAKPITGHVRFRRTNRGILADAQLTASLATECSRCLRPMELPVEVSIEEEFLPALDMATGKPLPTEAEPDVARLTDHHEVDLTPLVRDELLLAVPFAPLHDPNCPGLCPICGLPLDEGVHDHPEDDIDPRLEALRAFKPNDEAG